MNTRVTYSVDGESIIQEHFQTYAQGNFQERLFEVLSQLNRNIEMKDFEKIMAFSILLSEEANFIEDNT